MTHYKDGESKCQTHIVSTYRLNTITPVHRSRFRPASDTRGDQPRTDNALRRHAWLQGSNGRTRHCRRSGGFRTRHGPYERMSDPEDHAHPRMWRPCLPDGEVYLPERAPVRNPVQNLAKPASPLELSLRTFIVHTQTKPGKLWDATRGPQGAQECLICTHRTPSVRRSEGIPP